MRLSSHYQDNSKRQRINIIDEDLGEWLKEKIQGQKERNWNEPFTIESWEAEEEVNREIPDGNSSNDSDYTSDDSEGSRITGEADYTFGKKKKKKRGIRAANQSKEAEEAREAAERKKLEEELAFGCTEGVWKWSDPASEQSVLVIRHGGQGSIEKILAEVGKYIDWEEEKTQEVMEKGCLTQTTEVAKAVIKPQRKSKHPGRSVEVILQASSRQRSRPRVLGREEKDNGGNTAPRTH